MKLSEMIEYSELLEAAAKTVDPMELSNAADSYFCFDVENDEVQGIFDSGMELAVLLAAARADGSDARVYFGDDEEDNVRYFFIAKSEEEVVARVESLKPRKEDGDDGLASDEDGSDEDDDS